MSDRIPALTICQPWAWAIAAGYKLVENRSWPTKYRGPLLIHAGKSRSWLHAVGELRDGGFDVPDDLNDLTFGAVVAVAQLVDVIPFEQNSLYDDLRRDPFASGPVCWLLSRIRRLPNPVACRGAQGLWYPNAATLNRVTEQTEME